MSYLPIGEARRLPAVQTWEREFFRAPSLSTLEWPGPQLAPLTPLSSSAHQPTPTQSDLTLVPWHPEECMRPWPKYEAWRPSLPSEAVPNSVLARRHTGMALTRRGWTSLLDSVWYREGEAAMPRAEEGIQTADKEQTHKERPGLQISPVPSKARDSCVQGAQGFTAPSRHLCQPPDDRTSS